MGTANSSHLIQASSQATLQVTAGIIFLKCESSPGFSAYVVAPIVVTGPSSCLSTSFFPALPIRTKAHSHPVTTIPSTAYPLTLMCAHVARERKTQVTG